MYLGAVRRRTRTTVVFTEDLDAEGDDGTDKESAIGKIFSDFQWQNLQMRRISRPLSQCHLAALGAVGSVHVIWRLTAAALPQQKTFRLSRGDRRIYISPAIADQITSSRILKQKNIKFIVFSTKKLE